MAESSNEQQDGPFAPNGFALDGEIGHIEKPMVWRFVNCLWEMRKTSVDGLAEPVWGNPRHDISYLAVNTLQREANRFFKRSNLPFRVKRTQDIVMLIDERNDL